MIHQILSFKKCGEEMGTIKIKSRNGYCWFELFSSNGKRIFISKLYYSKPECKNNIEVIRKYFVNPTIIDETDTTNDTD